MKNCQFSKLSLVWDKQKRFAVTWQKTVKGAVAKLLLMTNANCFTVCDIFSLWFLFTVFLRISSCHKGVDEKCRAIYKNW